MVWGAGRLFLAAIARFCALVGVLLWPLRVRLGQWLATRNVRLVHRLAAAALVLALFGPGHPFIPFLGELHPSKARAVGDAPSVAMQEGWPAPFPAAVGTGAASAWEQHGSDGFGPPVARPGKRTALIVGINRARGGSPLPGSVADAENVRDALLAYGFPERNITMLTNEQATKSEIMHHLDALASRTPKDGIAVFAVASHTRRRGGRNELLTADGLRITAEEFATRLGRVRSRMWIAMPTCYAGGYAIPGIVGPGRVAVFASPGDQPTYQLGSAGSYLIINMVREAMIEGRAPHSVEAAFAYAKETLEREHPNRVPVMSDGIPGDLVLGEIRTRQPQQQLVIADEPASQPAQYESDDLANEDPSAAASPGPSPSPGPKRMGVSVCGKYRYNCQRP